MVTINDLVNQKPGRLLLSYKPPIMLYLMKKIEISGLKINSLSNFNCQSWILLLMMKIGIMY